MAAPNFADLDHGFMVASYAVGHEVGIAVNARLAFVRGGDIGGRLMFERTVEAFLLIADDPISEDTGVVNLSFGLALRNALNQNMAGVWCESQSLHASITCDDRGIIERANFDVQNRRTHGEDGAEPGSYICSRRPIQQRHG